MKTGLQKEDPWTNPVHNSVNSDTSQSSVLACIPHSHSSSHSVDTKLGNEKCFGLIVRSDEGWREYSCRQTVRHLETHHLLCPWDCFLFSQQEKSNKILYLTNNSEGTLHQFVCVSIYHIRITGIQHILCTDTEVPWLAQTTFFCASFCCIIFQSSLACFNLP